MLSVAKLRNYDVVIKTFLKYLPSRIFVVLNSLVIVPIFAYFLSTAEMSVFQISIGILNLVCTMSTDWIAKAVLRFYSRYKKWKETDKFFSCIMTIELISFLIIFLSYFIFKDIVAKSFFVPPYIFLITLILVIPCGIRQMLYQILRVLKMPFLYTVSIIVYQISLLLLFFAYTHFIDNLSSIIIAMTFAISFIDIFILYRLKFKENIRFSFDKKILKNIFIYAIPLVITSVCIWVVLHFGKFVFQQNKDFINTAIVGTAWFFVTNALAPLFSLLNFAIFPTVVKKFERRSVIKGLMESVLNSYILIFIPFVCIFCFYPFKIAQLAFREEYINLGILFPACALTIFIHEFMKLMNIKYHLKNKTYIETTISLLVAIFSVILNLILISKFGILGFSISLVTSIFVLTLLNSLVKFRYLDYLNLKKIFKCFFLGFLVCFAIFLVLSLIFIKWQSNVSTLLQVFIFVISYFVVVQKLKKYIL